MTSPAAAPREPRRQVGALPMGRAADGTRQILLVTSRETRRWVIPKGWPMKKLKRYEAAAREAYEEAGLVGQIGKRKIGEYAYEKRLKSQATVTCVVSVFPLEVEKQLKHWPEQKEREGRWFTISEAADSVDEPGLAAIIRSAGRDDASVSAA